MYTSKLKTSKQKTPIDSKSTKPPRPRPSKPPRLVTLHAVLCVETPCSADVSTLRRPSRATWDGLATKSWSVCGFNIFQNGCLEVSAAIWLKDAKRNFKSASGPSKFGSYHHLSEPSHAKASGRSLFQRNCQSINALWGCVKVSAAPAVQIIDEKSLGMVLLVTSGYSGSRGGGGSRSSSSSSSKGLGSKRSTNIKRKDRSRK